MALLGLFLAEDANQLDRSVLTDAEMNSVVSEAATLDPTDPQREQFVDRVNRGAKSLVVPTDDLRIRSQYSIRAHMLPEAIRTSLASGALKVVNKAYYRIIEFNGKQNDLMQNADSKVPGITNINSRKLEVNEYFLLTSIILQCGTKANDTDDPCITEFGRPCREVLNGEFSLKNGDKIIIPPSSARIFDTFQKNDVVMGEWSLDNPKFIAPQTEIIPELKLPENAPENLVIKFILVGGGLCKA